METKQANNQNSTRFPLDASFQGVKYSLFLLFTILMMVIIEFKETV